MSYQGPLKFNLNSSNFLLLRLQTVRFRDDICSTIPSIRILVSYVALIFIVGNFIQGLRMKVRQAHWRERESKSPFNYQSHPIKVIFQIKPTTLQGQESISTGRSIYLFSFIFFLFSEHLETHFALILPLQASIPLNQLALPLLCLC